MAQKTAYSATLSLKMYDLNDEEYAKLETNDIALMKFGFKLMKQVFFW